jgi:hypothetical protein
VGQPPEAILALQRSAGNAAVGRLMRAQVAMSDGERSRVQAARAFWQSLTGTPATQGGLAEQVAAAPAEIREVLPPDAEVAPAAEGPAAEGPAAESPATEAPAAAEAPAATESPAAGGYDAATASRPGSTDVGYVNSTAKGGYDADLAPGAKPPSTNAGYVNATANAGLVTEPGADGAAEAAEDPAAALAPVRPAKGWAGLRNAVRPGGPAGAKIAPGREGPIKQLHWATYWLEAIDPQHRPGHLLAKKWELWAASDAEVSFWEWLDANGKDLTKSVDYLDEEERKKFMLLSQGGMLMQNRQPYNTQASFAPWGQASGWSIFVVSAAGVFYAAEPKENKLHHSSLLAGGAVRAAGEIRVVGGKLEGITPLSGHYRPGNDHLRYAVQQLEARGVDIGATAVGDVTTKPAGNIDVQWFRAPDYLANGTAGTRVPRPAGHSHG